METKEYSINRLKQVISYLRTKYNQKIQIEDLEELSKFINKGFVAGHNKALKDLKKNYNLIYIFSP